MAGATFTLIFVGSGLAGIGFFRRKRVHYVIIVLISRKK